MTRDELALALWREQLARGLGDPGEVADEERLDDWWSNRSEPVETYDRAAAGDVAALVAVRTEAGLPVVC